MKKALAFLLAMSMTLLLVACGEETPGATVSTEQTETTAAETTAAETTEETTAEETTSRPADPDYPTAFDESSIVFSFAAISDVHIDGTDTMPGQKFLSALKQLKAQAAKNDEDGIDAVLVVGDLINDAYRNTSYYATQTGAFKTIYESVFDPEEVPMIYTIGNHDVYKQWTMGTVFDAKNISKVLGDAYFKTDVDPDMLADEECRHCVVNGYHIVTMTPCSYSPITYTSEALTWLDETLAEITAEDPNQYVIVLTHPMIHDTVYGSDLDSISGYWYTDDLTDILSKYPQAVTFSGHLHFPLNDPRSVMQTSFTSFGCASVRYMAIEDGGYEDMAGKTTMNDMNEYSQGLLVQMDKYGNLRATRMDFYNEETIGEPWELSYPVSDGSHLTKYSKARGDETQNEAPVMSDSLTLTEGTASGATLPITLSFAAATDDEFAHHYVISYYNTADAANVTQKKVLTDFYRHPDSADMKDSYTMSLGAFESGTYCVEVTAYDSWGAASNTVKKEFTVTVTAKPTEATVYADFDFANGTITDKCGNIKITNNGAVVTKQLVMTPTVKSATIDVLKASADKYVLCEFSNLKTAADVESFAAGGFSVEAFYVMSKSGKVQGVVCGTQDGGWGLAETASGVPYFITGSSAGKYNPSVTASAVSSEALLVHVVAVYDPASKSSTIYVNGKKNATQSISGSFKVGTGLAFNRFSLGNDVTAAGVGGDFPVSDMTMVDAKIYQGALTEAQVKTAYENALALVK